LNEDFLSSIIFYVPRQSRTSLAIALGQRRRWHLMTLKQAQSARFWIRKTASRRSLRNPIRCFD